MTVLICKFRTDHDKPVELNASMNAPIAFLRLGTKNAFALDVDSARRLRDGLTRFIDAQDAMAPQLAKYAALLGDPAPGTPDTGASPCTP